MVLSNQMAALWHCPLLAPETGKIPSIGRTVHTMTLIKSQEEEKGMEKEEAK